jgi:hypothetical protein
MLSLTITPAQYILLSRELKQSALGHGPTTGTVATTVSCAQSTTLTVLSSPLMQYMRPF